MYTNSLQMGRSECPRGLRGGTCWWKYYPSSQKYGILYISREVEKQTKIHLWH